MIHNTKSISLMYFYIILGREKSFPHQWVFKACKICRVTFNALPREYIKTTVFGLPWCTLHVRRLHGSNSLFSGLDHVNLCLKRILTWFDVILWKFCIKVYILYIKSAANMTGKYNQKNMKIYKVQSRVQKL